MSVMAGMEDLKPSKVVGWVPDTGHLLVLTKNDNTGSDIKEYEMYVSPNGTLKAKEVVPDLTHDQTPLTEEEQQERMARRWRGIDQS